jgi:hypothetical protein
MGTTLTATFPTEIKLFGTIDVPVQWDAPTKGSSTSVEVELREWTRLGASSLDAFERSLDNVD